MNDRIGTDQPSLRSVGNPPTSDNGVTSTELTREPDPLFGYFTLQWAVGGLFDSRLVPGWSTCLIAVSRSGSHLDGRLTLCGKYRFDKNGPGWSIRGGVSGPGVNDQACEKCLALRRPDLPVAGLTALFAEPHYDPWAIWSADGRSTQVAASAASMNSGITVCGSPNGSHGDNK